MHGSLGALLAAAPAAIEGLPNGAGKFLATVREAMRHCLEAEALRAPVLADSARLLDYLCFDMAHHRSERLRALFLDCRNALMSDEIVAQGLTAELNVFPREIMRRALELGASGLILVHNHPAGDPNPSRADIDATRTVARAAAALDIKLHDHLIVGRAGWTSLRALGLL